MTKEEQKILFNDLCARAPYGTKIAYNAYGKLPISRLFGISIHELLFEEGYAIEHCKPYLRPMSSMTDEEKKEYDVLSELDDEYWQPYDSAHLIDWLNSHHFDYRGLIEKGLALEAPVGMYETEED